MLDNIDTYTKSKNKKVYMQNKYFMKIYISIAISKEYSCKFKYLKGIHATKLSNYINIDIFSS